MGEQLNPDSKVKWVTRNFQPGDEEDIIGLWKIVFPDGEMERAEKNYWEWLFMQCPSGQGIIRVAVDGSKIVGQYTVIPLSMNFQGTAITATLSLDTMTHPDYRRQGMFERLANELYSELGCNGIPVTYGFPNENSIGGFTKKLDWGYIASLPVFVRPIKPAKILDKMLASSWLLRLAKPMARIAGSTILRVRRVGGGLKSRIHWVESFDDQANKLWREFYDPSKIALTREARFLNWRYFQNPSRDYHCLAYMENGDMIGYIVFRIMEQIHLIGGMITEIMARPGRNDALDALLDFALEHFNQQGADLAACLIWGEPNTSKMLRQKGFIVPPNRFSMKNWHFGARVNNGSISASALKNPSNWYLTFGDTDII